MDTDELYEIADELHDEIKEAESMAMGALNRLRPIRSNLTMRGTDMDTVEDAAFEAQSQADYLLYASQQIRDAAETAEQAIDEAHDIA